MSKWVLSNETENKIISFRFYYFFEQAKLEVFGEGGNILAGKGRRIEWLSPLPKNIEAGFRFRPH
ncbi:MAG: hypothetical protein ACI81T_000909 [Bacteroidia bacterium]